MEEKSEYSQFVKHLYERGFYVERYGIGLMSYEVLCDFNKIIVIPAPLNDEEVIYVFTGTEQKAKILSDSTEYRLYLEDTSGKEFRDDDLIMMSIVRVDSNGENIRNLYTRNYTTWKFGIRFGKGLILDSNKYIIFQSQKNIGKFDIDIRNVDLFRKKNKRDMETDNMMWID